MTLSKGITPYLILAAIVFLFYGNTLANGFVHDDVWQVKDRPVGEIFKSCIAEEIVGGCQRGFYWRPMQYVSYFVTFRISSSPVAFHFVNLVYFWMAASLVYGLVSMLIYANVKRINANARMHWLPFVASVIFVVHPINSEVVNWVSATPELLMVIFTLLALIFFVKAHATHMTNKSNKTYTSYLLSLVFFFLALLSKETAAVVLPLALISADLLLISADKRRLATRLKNLAWFLFPLIAYLFLRTAVLGRIVYKYEGYYALSAPEQLLNALALLPRYLLKLVYPLPLSFQGLILPIRSFDMQVLVGFLVLVVSLGSLIWFWRRRLMLITFGLGLILLGILPPLVFANKLGQFIFSERYLLFATIGFAIVVAEAANTLIRTNGKRIGTNNKIWIMLSALVLYIAGSWFVVVQRNKDWKDNAASYRAMIHVDEHNSNAHFQLGRIYASQGDLATAGDEFKKVLELDSGNADAKAELGFLENVYSFDDVYSFNYPMGWKVSRQNNVVTVSEADMKVEITIDFKKVGQTYEEYLQARKPIGEVVNQGLAQIPNVDLAYVRIYPNQNTSEVGSDSSEVKERGKFEFFLFKGSNVVKVYLLDVKSQPDMADFNKILGSIRISH